MIATSTIMLGISMAGLATSAYGQMKAADAQEEQAAASKKAEMARKEQARLAQIREQRKIFRDAQAARAVASSNFANAGVDAGSSAYGGAIGQVDSAMTQQSSDSFANYQIGQTIFDANAQYAEAGSRVSRYGGFAQLGKDIYAAAGPISRVGSTIMGGPNQDVGIYDWNAYQNVRKA
jgi:hypothetical protein